MRSYVQQFDDGMTIPAVDEVHAHAALRAGAARRRRRVGATALAVFTAFGIGSFLVREANAETVNVAAPPANSKVPAAADTTTTTTAATKVAEAPVAPEQRNGERQPVPDVAPPANPSNPSPSGGGTQPSEEPTPTEPSVSQPQPDAEQLEWTVTANRTDVLPKMPVRVTVRVHNPTGAPRSIVVPACGTISKVLVTDTNRLIPDPAGARCENQTKFIAAGASVAFDYVVRTRIGQQGVAPGTYVLDLWGMQVGLTVLAPTG